MGLFQPHALAASRYSLKLGGWKLNDLFRQHFYLLAMLTFLTGHKQCTLQDLNNLYHRELQENILASGREQ